MKLGFAVILLLFLGLPFVSSRARSDALPPVGFSPVGFSPDGVFSPLFDPQLALDQEGRILAGKNQKRGYLANLFWLQASHCEKHPGACALAREARRRISELLQTKRIILWRMPWENRFGEPAFWLYFWEEPRHSPRPRQRGNHGPEPGDKGQDGKEQGQWLQHWMLREGLAYLWPENRTKLSDHALRGLQAMERQAQEKQKGLWAKRELGLQHLTAIKGTFAQGPPDLPAFYLAEGSVQAVALKGQWLYFNFGENWREDATLALSLDRFEGTPWQDFWKARLKAARKKVPKKITAADLRSLFALCQDCKIKVRGWWYQRYGPHMILTSPRQLQVLIP